MTAKFHAGNDYSDLEDKCRDIPNIEVVITDNSGEAFPGMLEEMAKAKALVCPLRQDRLDYCVGLSTIADAEGLRKPLIITYNKYHSNDRRVNFTVVETVDDWINAIQLISKSSLNNFQNIHFSMQQAYEKMKIYMSL